jgi:hypothetical protein
MYWQDLSHGFTRIHADKCSIFQSVCIRVDSLVGRSWADCAKQLPVKSTGACFVRPLLARQITFAAANVKANYGR